jgi:hypothetical protein
MSSGVAATRQTGGWTSLTQVPDLARDVRQSKLESRKLAKWCNALLRLSFLSYVFGIDRIDTEFPLFVSLQMSSWSKWLMKYCPVAVLLVMFEIAI